jgi:hypothetical protein
MKTFKTIILISAIILPITAAMAQTAKVNLSIAPDRKTLIISSDTPQTQLDFTGDVLDALISQVGQIRSSLRPDVTQVPKPLQGVIRSAVWYLAPKDDNPGNLLLAIRHPGFGWIGMNLSPADAEKLSTELHKQAQGREKI